MSDHSALVRLAGVSILYGSREVIRSVDLEVNRSEFVTVIGKSGSGKTTLLKGIAGLLPYQGKVELRGRLRMVFQQDLLLPWLTVAKNVALGLAETTPQEPIIENFLAELGIAHLSDRYPWQISGGERERAAAARAFVSYPDVILMDEPFGSLDVLTRERLQCWLLEYWTKHRAAILFVTHDIEEALILGDRVVILNDGSLGDHTVVPFPRPREPELRFTTAFGDLRRQLHARVLSD